MTARDLAVKAFWSEHALCQIYLLAHGRYPAAGFSLRNLIRFAETLPQHVIDALAQSEQGDRS